MLSTHERVVLENLGSERITIRTQSLRLEGCGIAFEQLLNEPYNRRLARPGLTVEHQELLDFTSFSSQNRPDRPLELLALLRQI